MPGPLLHLGATVLCAHGGQAQPTAPNPRVLVSGPAGRDAGGALRWSPAARSSPPARQRAVRHRAVGRRRRRACSSTASRCCCIDSQAVCAPTGTPLIAVGRADAGDRELRRMNARLPLSRSTAAAAPRRPRRRRARPRPDRAGAVHRARRARQPARLRQRPACSSCSRRTAPSSPRRLQFLVQGALQQWLGDLIARRRRAASTSDDATLHRRACATRAAHAGARAVASFDAEARVMSATIRLLRTEPRRRAARRGAGQSAATAERHRLPRGRGPASAASQCTSCIRSALVPATPLDRGERRDRRRRARRAIRRVDAAVQPARPTSLTRRRSRPPGDFSTYTLRLVASAGDAAPPAGFDPALGADRVLASRSSARATSTAAPTRRARRRRRTAPAIDYLARDYASFRRLMLDRLAALMPDWRERSPADLGSRWSSCWPYVGDQLSYYQDAVATEAYLGTARRRVSVRRHARLVDYADARRLQRARLGRVRGRRAADGLTLAGCDPAPASAARCC